MRRTWASRLSRRAFSPARRNSWSSGMLLQRKYDSREASSYSVIGNVVGGEVVGGLESDADEVADGVLVLGPVEAAQSDTARVAGLGAVHLRGLRRDPPEQPVGLRGGGLGPARGGHVARAEVLGDRLP